MAALALVLAGCAANAPVASSDPIVYLGRDAGEDAGRVALAPDAGSAASRPDAGPAASAGSRPTDEGARRGVTGATRASNPFDEEDFGDRVDRPIRLDRPERRAAPADDAVAEGRAQVREARRRLGNVLDDADRLAQDDVTVPREIGRRARALSEAQNEAFEARRTAPVRGAGTRTTASAAERTQALSERLRAEGRPDFGQRSRVTVRDGLPSFEP